MNKSAIIARLEQQFSQTLLTLLDDMFASCDDLFFDLASRATSNSEQNLYFESMREVRVRTRTSRNDYQQGLAQLFKSIAQQSIAQHSATPTAKAAKTKEEMQLVDKDDMEQNVAVSTMTSRARSVNKNALFELRSRLSELYQQSIQDDDANPIDPSHLIELFADATQPMVIEIKARIILLKQYERYVVNRLPELYKNTNTLLQEQGVAFNDQRKIKKQRSKPRSLGSSALLESVDDDELPLLAGAIDSSYRYSSPAFNELSQLLSNVRSLPEQSHNSQIPLFSSGTGTAIANHELLQLLDSSPSLNNSNDGKNIGQDLRSYIEAILTRGMPQGQRRAVQQVDEDVINLVAMFFDFVLDDKNIPDNVKTLISRLQMPILKIALKDRRFFSDTEHPAREFINEVARISIGVDEESADAGGLLQKIELWVQDIQTNIDNLEAAFAKALTELKNYHAQSEKRADLVQKRTREAVAGQAKKELATLRSQRAIQEAMDGKEVAVPISEFIVKHWQQVLYVTFVKESEESQAWLDQLQAMQDIIWCSHHHVDEKSRQRVKRVTADLMDKLALGLKQTTLNEQQITSTIEELKGVLVSVAEPKESEPAVKVETFAADTDEALQSLKQQKGWKEMTALERQKVQFQALTYEFIERAEAVQVGSWLEFKSAGGSAVVRCKLAAKLETSDSYVFVNRLGFKALEKPRKEFAFDLQRKRARLLRTGPLFDRSLHKMVTSLKNIAQ